MQEGTHPGGVRATAIPAWLPSIPSFPTKSLEYKVDTLNIKDYELRFYKSSQDLMIPQVFFSGLCCRFRVEQDGKQHPKQSQGFHVVLDVGILTGPTKAWRERKGRCGGNHSANTHLVLVLLLESSFSFLCSCSWLGESSPWRERNQSHFPGSFGGRGFWKKNNLVIFPFLPTSA